MMAAGNKEDSVLVSKMTSLFGNLGSQEKGAFAGMGQESASAAAKKALPFWKVYTPGNIAREIRYRLTK
jgi:hypothetical protein